MGCWTWGCCAMEGMSRVRTLGCATTGPGAIGACRLPSSPAAPLNRLAAPDVAAAPAPGKKPLEGAAPEPLNCPLAKGPPTKPPAPSDCCCCCCGAGRLSEACCPGVPCLCPAETLLLVLLFAAAAALLTTDSAFSHRISLSRPCALPNSSSPSATRARTLASACARDGEAGPRRAGTLSTALI